MKLFRVISDKTRRAAKADTYRFSFPWVTKIVYNAGPQLVILAISNVVRNS